MQDNKNNDYKSNEEYKEGDKIHSPYSATEFNGNIQNVNYRVDKSNEFQTDVNSNIGASPYKISLSNPIYNPQVDTMKETVVVSEVSPIVVEPINSQEQKSSKSIEMDTKDEYHQTENHDKVAQLIEQINTNQTEDRKDDIKEAQVADQILIQDKEEFKQTEFTIPFKKPNSGNGDELKYNDEETMKKDIINKVIQNLNDGKEQSDPHLHFKSTLTDKPLKVIGADTMEMERQENYQITQGHSNFKSQKLSNKPLRLFGYNPSTFGSLYDMQIDYNRPSQIQQSQNSFNQGYFTGFGTHTDDIKSQQYENSGMYYSQPSSSLQTGNYKGYQKYNVPTQPLYYYDPNSMLMIPVYTNAIQNTYPTTENKLQPAQPQVDSNKGGFNLMQILSGGTFYKGSEQAEGSQQTTVKDSPTKQDSNKLEKLKPLETNDKSKLPQTLMFYVNPSESSQMDIKPHTSSPMQLTLGQNSQPDCNGQKSKAPTFRSEKPLQPIPLCSDCVPALGLMGLQNPKFVAAQQKKSSIAPQVMPIWNGQNTSKLNYLILPNPISK